MIKLIQSSRLKLPLVYLVESYNDLKELPVGIPFIRASMAEYNKCVQMMEWEVLWKSCKETGLPFNWEKILRDNGYSTWKYGIAESDSGDLYFSSSFKDTGAVDDWSEIEASDPYASEYIDASKFLNDISYKVEVDVLRDLRLLPTWLDDIEAAVKENVTNAIVYNPSLYTKKLDLPLGGVEYAPAQKNVIIIDISGSIPRGISSTMLVLAKTLSEQFYADLVITGSKSTLYEYGTIDKLEMDEIFTENGQDNDQTYFKKLVKEPRKYKTALVFGDNHQPGHNWSNSYNIRNKTISKEDGQKLCKWEIADIMSFHTTDHSELAGYAQWFNTTKITHVEGWVKDLN